MAGFALSPSTLKKKHKATNIDFSWTFSEAEKWRGGINPNEPESFGLSDGQKKPSGGRKAEGKPFPADVGLIYSESLALPLLP